MINQVEIAESRRDQALQEENKQTTVSFARIPYGPKFIEMKVGARKVFAGVIAFSFETNGRRISTANGTNLAKLLNCGRNTVSRNLQLLSKAGLITPISVGTSREFQVNLPEAPRWVHLSIDSPVWRLDPLPFSLWLALASYGSRKGVWVYPSDVKLQDRAKISSGSSLHETLKLLESIGAIERRNERYDAFKQKRYVRVIEYWDSQKATSSNSSASHVPKNDTALPQKPESTRTKSSSRNAPKPVVVMHQKPEVKGEYSGQTQRANFEGERGRAKEEDRYSKGEPKDYNAHAREEFSESGRFANTPTPAIVTSEARRYFEEICLDETEATGVHVAENRTKTASESMMTDSSTIDASGHQERLEKDARLTFWNDLSQSQKDKSEQGRARLDAQIEQLRLRRKR